MVQGRVHTVGSSTVILKSIVVGYGYAVNKEELHPGTIRMLAEKT